MKLTQTMKNWLNKVFAWWPWKQSTQFEYSNAVNPLNKGMIQDTVSRSTIDGIMPQTGIVPRLSTVEEWPERVDKSELPATGEFAEPPSPSSVDGENINKSTTSADEILADTQTSPSPQQRLEFLRYLIKRGIVNEGSEEEM